MSDDKIKKSPTTAATPSTFSLSWASIAKESKRNKILIIKKFN